MNEIEKRDNIPPTSTLSKQGITAFFCTAGGVFLIVLRAVTKIPVVGLIAGAVVCAVGIGALLSKDPSDRKPGAVITVAGALAILSKIPKISGAANVLLGIGVVSLLALGIWNAVKFFTGLKKRS